MTALAGVLGQVLDQPARVVEGPVRVVRGVQQDLVALHPLERAGQFGLVLGVVQRLGGELDVLLDVFRRLALDVHRGLARLVDGVHPPHQRQDPGERVLDEHDPQGGEPVEDAVEDQAHHLVRGQQRVGDHEVVVVAGQSDRRHRAVRRSGRGDRWQLTGMSCLVAAAQIGSYFGSPHDGRGSALIRTCAMYGCSAHSSISRGCALRLLDARRRSTRATARASCCGCPASGWPASGSRRTHIACWPRAARAGYAAGSRIAMSEPASMISCLNARSGSLPANSPSSGTCRRAWRTRARSRERRSRSARRRAGYRKYLLRYGSGMYGASSPGVGIGWTSESTHADRRCVRLAGALVGWLSTVIVGLPSPFRLLCLACAATAAGMSMP